MAAKLFFFSVVVALSVSVCFSIGGNTDSLESVPDLEKAMYLVVDGYPCVRLLNLSGAIGCANPGRSKVVAPLVRLKTSEDKLDRLSAVMVSLDTMKDFLARVSSDLDFAKKVAGVLVESEAEAQNELAGGFSPDDKFPQAEFAPYKKNNYEWNPVGSGIMWKRYDFPVFLLSKNSTFVLQKIAEKNAKRNKAYPTDVAEFDFVMQTTTAGSHNSESCLKDQSCLPLGGYSVWSSLPPINVSSSKTSKPILLAVASQDSSSFFHDKSLGADSSLSGMISLLAAVDALSRVDGLHELKKQLVFLFPTGESWGYLGSRRFLAELDAGTDAVTGLNSTLIEQVLEIGSVGKGSTKEATKFFAHVGKDLSGAKDMLTALQLASDSLGPEGVKIEKASSSNPGVPPSSLMAFLSKNSSTSGIVLEDFDSTFTNKFYHSHLDSLSNINSSLIVRAASVVARALYILANDGSQLNTQVLNLININATLIEELLECFLTCDPGLACGLVKDFIVPSSICSRHYVGVLQGSPSPYPQYVDDTSRFIWNFLSDRTSIWGKNVTSCSQGCQNPGEVCVRAEIEGKSSCMISSTRYVPAYSTRLKFEGSWRLMPPNVSDEMGMVDPVWAESYWNTLGVRVYTLQSSSYDNLVLLCGVGITALAYLLIVAVRALFLKALKQD
ncbi:nicastrin isoform X2 [Aristolochia californica]|uniref:nicastrin isoform X2 n=1 Tax=Aristolochia californica TaxID=171875 RepID=UPI0035DAA88D